MKLEHWMFDQWITLLIFDVRLLFTVTYVFIPMQYVRNLRFMWEFQRTIEYHIWSYLRLQQRGLFATYFQFHETFDYRTWFDYQ